MEKAEALKTEMLMASIIWFVAGVWSARLGEVKWAAYFLKGFAFLGTAGVFLGLALKRVQEKQAVI